MHCVEQFDINEHVPTYHVSHISLSCQTKLLHLFALIFHTTPQVIMRSVLFD